MFECEVCGEPCTIELFCGGARVCLCGACEAEQGRSPIEIAEARALAWDEEDETPIPSSEAHRT